MWTWNNQGTPDKMATALAAVTTAPISAAPAESAPSDDEQSQFSTVRDLVVAKMKSYSLPAGFNALDVKLQGGVSPTFSVIVRMTPIKLVI